MTRRVLWLSLWITLTLWLGGLWGCTGRNSAGLSRQVGDWVEQRQAANWSTPVLPPPQPASTPAPQAGQSPQQADTGEKPIPAAQSGPAATTAAEQQARPGEKNILERWSWPAIIFRPAADPTAQLPAYFADCPIGWSPRQDKEADPLASRSRPQESEQADNWNPTNALGAVVQPVKFGADIVLFPIKLVLLRPGGITQPVPESSPDTSDGGTHPGEKTE